MSVIASECPPIDVTPNPNRVVHHGPLAPLRPCLLHLADLCRTSGVSPLKDWPGTCWFAAIEPALADLPEVAVLKDAQTLPVEAVRHRVLNAAVEAIVALSKRAPLLLVFDDLQWADELTLKRSVVVSGLGCGAAHPADGRRRFSQRGNHHPTGCIGRRTECPHHVTRTTGRRRGRDAGGGHARGVFATFGICHFVAEHAAGNPFFISEYLHTIVDEGLLQRNRYGEWALADAMGGRASAESWLSRLQRLELPRTLRAIVERRLRGLEPQLAEVVAIGALLGREFAQSYLVSCARCPNRRSPMR